MPVKQHMHIGHAHRCHPRNSGQMAQVLRCGQNLLFTEMQFALGRGQQDAVLRRHQHVTRRNPAAQRIGPDADRLHLRHPGQVIRVQ